MRIPKIMKCVKISSYGPAENLKYDTSFVPEIKGYEVLINVKASGVNRPDVLQRKGLYSPPKGASTLPGLEVSGKIVKIGSKVKKFKVNQDVCALVHGGGYAEFCKAHESHVLSIPRGLNYVEAAGIPETYFTVWYNLFNIAKIKKNQTLLVHGGASGIGTTAIQMAKLIGCKVITTVGSERKKKFCNSLGADLTILYNKDDFFSKIQSFTNNYGVDIILDMVGKEYFIKNLNLLKDKGKFISIAFLTGNDVKLDLALLLKKRIPLTGSTLRPRTIKEKEKIARNVKKMFWSLFEKKTIRPIIYKTLKLKDAFKAHRIMESSRHIGKIILVNRN